ncbi:cobalt-zinc-cadmium efflux system membrane fusion protein [Arcticibacter tournemirensis]|uniref:Efflux RND transporter periplasmic adaptor subunit n=1 Tax=Arcticibacter tournemirensis TaxID=699437 RepID=A0A5M9GM83_9SPHI|nr:efflux RND transporter periplasmic adaptor subunit [Arcticibacter tournemirensis]KAA8475450.1 efflux RND transporter periplasmic adaptor subunit [Arcticibacter tournemirensis]TQM51753.1 cobalt-zinc-cadmium efflux system membrane fusion protein [Arcticibacter tournemirensis]
MKKLIQFKRFFYITSMAAFFLVSCGNNKDAENTETEVPAKEDANTVELTPAQYKTSGITLGKIEKRSISGTLKVNGFVDVPPENLISITTQMGGIVKSTPLLQGSVVKKGQVIAVLQNQEYVQMQQDYLENKSQLELSESEYNRQQELAKQNVNSQKVLQQAKSQYQTMRSRASALKQRLQLININANSLTPDNIRSTINIYAPINGYVTKVNVNSGKFVSANDVMFEIVNSANLHVELKVFQKDVNKVAKGQKVRFSLPNESEERTATVTLVGREINADRTVTVHCVADFKSKNLTPGAYLQASIETGGSEVDALPETAVVDFEGKKYIFLETGKNIAEKEQEKTAKTTENTYHFLMVEITTGPTDGGYVQVELPADFDKNNAKIVTKGAYDLLSKMKNSEEE